MKAYLDVSKRILEEGVMVENQRTGVGCLTIINVSMRYDLTGDKIPLVTTRKAPWKLAIAELLGYIRGYTNAQDFADLGAKSWFANANENKAWLANPNRKGENDCGYIYGAVGRAFGGHIPGVKPIDQLKKIVDDLGRGVDDRGEILTFWDPSSFEYGCLRPCMHTHQFSLLKDKLYITSYQR